MRTDFDVENGGQPAEPLGADSECVDLLVELDSQRLELVLRATCQQLMHVERLEQRLLREQHRFLRGASDTDAQ